MRVVLLTSARGWRGTISTYAKVAQGLGQRGHVAHLVTVGTSLVSRLAAMGLRFTTLSGRNLGPWDVWSLIRILREVDAGLMIVDTARDLGLAACASVVHPARIVFRYNAQPGQPALGLWHRVYRHRIAACVYQSRYVEANATARAPWIRQIRSFRIPNGYDTDQYKPCPEEGRRFRSRYRIQPDAAVVVTVAMLERGKGHKVAIQALGQIKDTGVSVTYLVCGEGEQESEVRALARAGGLPAVFTGFLEPSEVVAALSAADVVVHPSLHENFPNAVGEAMSCGRPVVAADAGGTGELVGRHGEAGLLVPPGDSAALATAVRTLLTDPGRRVQLGTAARQRIETDFSIDRMIGGYEAALLALSS